MQGSGRPVTIITGASAGIGRELALHYAEKGSNLVLAARGAEELEKVAQACRTFGVSVVAQPCDVAQREDNEALVRRTVAEFGRLDTLILNAGISMWSTFEALQDLKQAEHIMQVNFWGAVYATRAALPHLRQSQGRLVAVSSLTGKTGVPTRTLYGASKHAMVGFFDALRIELMGSGVSITVICPGFVATGVRRHAVGPDGKPLGESPVQEDKVMSAETCARIIYRAAQKRKREVIMTLRGKLGIFLRMFLPGLIDRMAKKAIETGR
ncbi:MAG: SDR family oxidoreductase [Acidobacteria bacterium]|nr:SDR family oxidoreductase [Acidobacteriota bacterium]